MTRFPGVVDLRVSIFILSFCYSNLNDGQPTLLEVELTMDQMRYSRL